MIKELIAKNRSYRRFYQDKNITKETLTKLIDLARLSPSARNAQLLKYFLSCNKSTNEKIFPHLSWAGYLKDWEGPANGEHPSAYIIVLNDTNISSNYFCDDGIATQSILLGAVEKDLGGCIIGSVNRQKLQHDLALPTHLKIIHVITLGYPKEEVIIEDMKDDNHEYWRDKEEKHHVPKRSLDELIIN